LPFGAEDFDLVWMPPNLHDWRHFIKPSELVAIMEWHGLLNQDVKRRAPSLKPPQLIALLRKRKRSGMTFGEFGRRAHMPGPRYIHRLQRLRHQGLAFTR